MGGLQITEVEFTRFRAMLYRIAGINLTPAKRELVCGRLADRIEKLGMTSFGEYYCLIGERPAELQRAVDLLTTNETYFFREPKHFDFVRREVLPRTRPKDMFRVWSAACSSGEEPYSLAMMLAEMRGATGWQVVGSDISMRVLDRAHLGLYPLERCQNIPPAYLRKYCLKGIDAMAGMLFVEPAIRHGLRFVQINLNAALPALGQFDLIFLRNVLIYFDLDTRRKVVARLLAVLKPGGHFIIGHSETLNDIGAGLEQVAPSIYRQPTRIDKARGPRTPQNDIHQPTSRRVAA